ncbi:MAG: hypothetical protein U0804_27585 [Gemmataceae bacterium]
MKYARYLRFAAVVFGGALVGVLTSLFLLYVLVEFDVFRTFRGLAWPVFLILLIAAFYFGGAIIGMLGGVLVGLRTDQQQPSRDYDPHALLKELLADPTNPPDGPTTANCR